MAVDPIEIPYLYNDHFVPGLWRYLLPKEVHRYRLPRERKATCDDCPQARFEGYDSLYRCCTYHPAVPNFLLGLALRQDTSRVAVQRLLKMGYVMPEGFIRTPHQWVDYLSDLGDEDFGVAIRVKCPNLSSEGLCNIYAFRNGVCSTFFCHHDHGSSGEKFWEALEEVVTHAEFSISQWAMKELGFDLEGYFAQLDSWAPRIEEVAEPEFSGWTEEIRRQLWGEHFGKEVEFLRACGELISKNRNRLYEIAENQEILEAEKFDLAMNTMVPKKYKDQIDPEDLDPGESIPLKDLYRDLRRKYRELWKVPAQLKLSQRVQFSKNPKDDDESRAFGDREMMLEFFCRKGGKTLDFREFIPARDHRLLLEFRKPQTVNEALLAKPLWKTLPDPMVFLAENVGKRVLEKV